MYYILAELTGVVAEILLAHIYFNGFFTKRSHPRWAMVGSYIAFGVILTALAFLPNVSFLRLVFCATGLGMIVYFFSRSSVLQAVYASISYSGLYVLNEMLVFGLFALFHIDVQQIMSDARTRTMAIIITHMLLWLCVLIVLAITKRRRTAITLSFLLTLTPGYIAGIVLGLSFCMHVLSGDEVMPIPILVFFCSCFRITIFSAAALRAACCWAGDTVDSTAEDTVSCCSLVRMGRGACTTLLWGSGDVEAVCRCAASAICRRTAGFPEYSATGEDSKVGVLYLRSDVSPRCRIARTLFLVNTPTSRTAFSAVREIFSSA